jgi:hypothetical protein
MKKLISINLLDDRFIVILLRFIKFGIIRTKSDGFKGFSIVFGISKIELQVNLSKTEKVVLDGYGKA